MSSYIYKQQMFNESAAGKRCIAYLKSIENTEIERRQANEIRNTYTMLFYKETGLNSYLGYIDNTYIPLVLFKQYNITVVDNKQTNNSSFVNNNYYNDKTTNKRKTAPTLVDGWFTYIVIMIALSIFNGRVLWWIFATIVFIIWRSSEIDKYN